MKHAQENTTALFELYKVEIVSKNKFEQ